MSTPTQPTEPARTPPASKVTWIAIGVVGGLALLAGGVFAWQQLSPAKSRFDFKAEGGYQFDSAARKFVDQADSNTPIDGCDVGSLQFTDINGQPTDLTQFLGKKNVVVVVTRGNTSGGGGAGYYRNICLYCATQTSRLITNYESFRERDAEVVVVFPLKQLEDRGSLADLREAIRREGTAEEPPFPLVLDVELQAVDQLGIRADLSKPATYIVDKQGQVKFAYVGANMIDRPSVQSMLDQLAAINADAK